MFTSNQVVPIAVDTPASTQTKNSKIIMLEGIGWAGSILVLCPYIIAFEKKVDFILNTLGATGLLVVCIKSKQYQSIIINTAWIIGGFYKYFANS
jgi:hypothetical protein